METLKINNCLDFSKKYKIISEKVIKENKKLTGRKKINFFKNIMISRYISKFEFFWKNRPLKLCYLIH